MSIAQAQDSSERRDVRRLPIRITVEYEDTEDFLTDYAANVSIGGMFIETAEPLAVGTRFKLRFAVPGRPTPIDTVGEVRWMQSPDKSAPMAPGMGVRFDDLEPADAQAVAELLAAWD